MASFGYGSVSQVNQYIAQGKLDSARKVFSKFKTSYPEESITKYLEGKLEMDASLLFKNYRWLDKHGVNDSTKEDAYFQLAHYYYLKEELGMSIYYFRKCIVQNLEGKLAPKAHYWMGLTCSLYGKKKESYLDSAEFHFRSASKMIPETNPIYSLSIAGISQLRWLKGEKEASGAILEMARENQTHETRGVLGWLGYFHNQEDSDNSKSIAFAKSLAYQCPHCLETSLLDIDVESIIATAPKLQASPQKTEVEISPPVKITKEDPKVALQLGAYSNQENALAFKKQLKEKGVDAIVLSEMRNGKSMFLVRVPGFPNRGEAEEYGEKKLTLQGLSYYVILPN